MDELLHADVTPRPGAAALWDRLPRMDRDQLVARQQATEAYSSGSDLVCDADGTFLVLEDNLRVPSGVSYVLENRAVTNRVFPELFASEDIHPVDTWTNDQAPRRATSRSPGAVTIAMSLGTGRGDRPGNGPIARSRGRCRACGR